MIRFIVVSPRRAGRRRLAEVAVLAAVVHELVHGERVDVSMG